MAQDYWQDITDGFRIAGEGMQQAVDGLTQAVLAARHAHAEHEDLRETVRRLEALVMQLIDKQDKKD